ncbi:hypothetical protein [Mucilaginibacter gynuensis]|uniref:hypothetical protein n=1 Tax=Mucilaginibacter gynuensis TaxID=1302236 RepID=UPI0031F18FD9
MINKLDQLRISIPIRQMFAKCYLIEQNRICFLYTRNEFSYEYETAVGRNHEVPLSGLFVVAFCNLPRLVMQVYLFCTGLEMLCFCNLRPDVLNNQINVAFVALGLCPDQQDIKQLRTRYPFANFNCVFGNDLLGKVLDCKVAMWYHDRDLSTLCDGTTVIFKYENKVIRLNADRVSLDIFKRTMRLKTNIKTLKPAGGFISFLAKHQ